MRKAIGAETARIVLCEILLVALILLTFAPSLRHVFRADHWKYLNYVRNTEGFLDTWSSSYSLTRQTNYGDSHLFRPLLYGCLALERNLFAADFQKYQVANLALHAANTCLLFLVLYRILQVMRPATQPATSSIAGPRSHAFFLLPFAASAFFAVNVPGSEMVIWTHIVAYQVWILLFLWVLYCLLAIQSWSAIGQSEKNRPLVYDLLHVADLRDCISHRRGRRGISPHTCRETWRNKGKAFLWFLSPLHVVGGHQRRRLLSLAARSRVAKRVGAVLPLLGQTYFFLMVQPFFPELNNPQAGARTNVPIATISANQILFSTFGLMLATALFSLYGVNGQDWRKKAGPWVLAMALIALVHGLIIITRLVMHPMRTALLWCSSYYCHFFVIYVLLSCVVIASSQLASDSVWRKFCTDYLSLALLAVALNSASITHQLCVSWR